MPAAPEGRAPGAATRGARGDRLSVSYDAYIQPAAYRHTYRTLPERVAFAQSFAGPDVIALPSDHGSPQLVRNGSNAEITR